MRCAAAVIIVLGALVATACQTSSDAADASTAPDAGVATTWTHEFPAMDVLAGEEIAEMCMSWTVENPFPLYVNSVELTAGPGWHHSNWVFTPDDAFEGPDGLWPCDERDFDQVSGAIRGGVLTAQSTQADHDTQTFLPGHAIVIPERARIIANAHALNTSETTVNTHLGVTLHAIPLEEVSVKLHPMSLEYRALVIPPLARSSFSTTCELGALHQEGIGRPVDFAVHYVLPHYHELGEGLTLTVIGGPHDGEDLWKSDSPIGEPAGGGLTPPYDLTGATGLRVTCAYDNPRDEVVRWGIGDQEMCAFLAFTDSEVTWAGGNQDFGANEVLGPNAEGVIENQAPCELYYFIPRD
jgi:hypothetical protein